MLTGQRDIIPVPIVAAISNHNVNNLISSWQ